MQKIHDEQNIKNLNENRISNNAMTKANQTKNPK